MSDYPKFMCRAGTSEEAWGVMIDSTAAIDEAHEEQLLEEGWVYRPDEIASPTDTEKSARAKKGAASEGNG